MHSPLVSARWLAARLQDAYTVVLDATLPPAGVTPPLGTRARYFERHIPGAVFFDIDELSDHNTSLPHMLPSAEVFARSMDALGVSDRMTIVVYEQAGVFSAPRAWWTLRTFGADSVYLLDGGLHAWEEAGLPLESGPVHRKPATFRATLDASAVKHFAEIQQLIAESGGATAQMQIIDGRPAGRYSGTAPEPRAGLPSGHMPGAISVPFTELVEHARLKSADQLRAFFSERHIDLERPVTTTCGSGVTAAVVLLALETAGARQVTLYDGSWAEYAQRPEAAIISSR
jgi:thiosulfate/3-mercaptopyruvate sulfurtransferase